MSNVVNAAFHTIRSAQGMDSLRATGKHVFDEDTGERIPPEVEVHTYSIPAIVTPYPSKWRHPIYWWKMRHLRADIEHHIKTTDAGLRERMAKLEAEAFLRGTGEL